VYVPALGADAGGSVTLPDDEGHHLARVLRAGVGDAVVLFDGAGREWDGEVAAIAGRAVDVRLLALRAARVAATPRVTLAIGLLKGDAMDDVVRDATALDVAAIVPLSTQHAVVPKHARGPEAIERWRRVAIAACKQCGRADLPAIRPVASFGDVVGDTSETRIMCVEPALAGSHMAGIAADHLVVLVGPEGGWAPEEVDTARRAGAHLVTFGTLTLRAALAPVVALSHLHK
jgi:16S rRNA (uracil1498-N3)-methyltransferase